MWMTVWMFIVTVSGRFVRYMGHQNISVKLVILYVTRHRRRIHQSSNRYC